MNRRLGGLLMAVAAGLLWGLSGTAAQWLMQHGGLRPTGLVVFRMGSSGPLLLAAVALGARIRRRGSRRGLPPAVLLVAPWRARGDRWRLLLFSLFGFAAVQATYLAAIDAGNAATATFLQYLAPGVVVLWEAWRERRLPEPRFQAALALGLAGTFLLATGGGSAFALTPAALAWGLLSALALAFYTVYPAPLLTRYGTPLVTGWAMAAGALALLPWTPAEAPLWVRALASGESWAVAGLLAFVAVGGTLVPFTLYLASLRSLKPSETSLAASVEPLAATLAAGLWLGVRLSPLQELGAAAVLAMVVLVTRTRAAGAPERPAGDAGVA
ncbi:MAG: EamA family transporter [Bacillota bacterium]|nr:EamA family transporter [Bacillota bacterium]